MSSAKHHNLSCAIFMIKSFMYCICTLCEVLSPLFLCYLLASKRTNLRAICFIFAVASSHNMLFYFITQVV